MEVRKLWYVSSLFKSPIHKVQILLKVLSLNPDDPYDEMITRLKLSRILVDIKSDDERLNPKTHLEKAVSVLIILVAYCAN
jgi:hypothetical protein